MAGIIRAGDTISDWMSDPKRIGVLTGGGDVPGLNSVIKSVTYRATEMGIEVLGLRRGWEGLTHVRPGGELDPDYVRPLDRRSTRTIDRTGGTVLHTSRTNPARMKAASLPTWLTLDEAERYRIDEDRYDLTPVVLEHLDGLGIDALVPIGGDDTLSFARILVDRGVPLVAIPKTMDNDVPGTEYCIGFSSAITRAKELIDRQRTTLGSHERIGVFRIFGRDAGFSALFAAYVTSARCVIPEAPYDVDALASLLADDHRLSPSHYAIVVTAEGAIWHGANLEELGEADAFGHRRKADVGEALAGELTRRTGIETLSIELTYDLRSGQPDALDQIVATTFANVAMDLLADGLFGRMVGIRDGKYAETSLLSTDGHARRVDVDGMYNRERFRPRYDGRMGRPLLLVGLSSAMVASS
jgi:6-phosphofructokinase